MMTPEPRDRNHREPLSTAPWLGKVRETTPRAAALVAAIAWLLVSGTPQSLWAQTAINVDRDIDFETLTNPALQRKPAELVWNTDVRPVWRAALRHGDSELQREVADSISRAHRLGMPGLSELLPELRLVLESPESHVDLKTSVAAAVVELDARDFASLLAEQSAHGPPPLQRVVERGLAQWDFQPARERWLARLRDKTIDPELVQLAVECLAEVGEPRAVEALGQLLLSPVTPLATRLATARALARLDAPQSLAWSRELRAGNSADAAFEAQLGVELLTEQSSAEAMEQLELYADHPEPTVAAVALRRLLELDPSRVLERTERMITSRDANIRRISVEALATDSGATSIRWLAHTLHDPVPDLRRQARKTLLQHASDETVKQVVVERAEEVLRQDDWRGIEQAIIVLTELEQRQINRQLLVLVSHRRGEVAIAASWAIKHLFEPQNAAPVLLLAERITDRAGPSPSVVVATVQTHLFEALGLLDHRPSIELLRRLVPKSGSNYPETRAAAIWALGFLLIPSDDAPLIRALEARLADVESDPPEEEEVRTAAAIALGRIADPESLPKLRRWYELEDFNSQVGRSCGWAIMQMTGEPLPEVEPYQREISDWPLMPLD